MCLKDSVVPLSHYKTRWRKSILTSGRSHPLPPTVNVFLALGKNIRVLSPTDSYFCEREYHRAFGRGNDNKKNGDEDNALMPINASTAEKEYSPLLFSFWRESMWHGR